MLPPTSSFSLSSSVQLSLLPRSSGASRLLRSTSCYFLPSIMKASWTIINLKMKKKWKKRRSWKNVIKWQRLEYATKPTSLSTDKEKISISRFEGSSPSIIRGDGFALRSLPYYQGSFCGQQFRFDKELASGCVTYSGIHIFFYRMSVLAKTDCPLYVYRFWMARIALA